MTQEDTPDTDAAPESTDGSLDALLDRIGDTIGVDLARLHAELTGKASPETSAQQTTKGPLRHPTDADIVNLAVEALIDMKQQVKAQDHPEVEDHRDLKVELNIDDPQVVLHTFATALDTYAEDLIGYLHENPLDDVSGASLQDTDDELITYLVEERDDDDRPAAILGGAKPLRLNLGNQRGMTEDELELVRLAHTAAARFNGYDRHLLLDEVLFLPQYDFDANPYSS